MKKGIKCLLIIIVLAALVVGGFFLYKHFTKKEINENVLEMSATKAIMEIANKEFKMEDASVGAYAEGHKILGSEMKEDKIYAYVVTEYGIFSIKTKESISASALPIALIFEKEEKDGYYKLTDYKTPEEGENFEKSLKELFPEDLIKEATSTNYQDKFYQEQIAAYLNKENEKVQALLKEVMNNEKKFTTEDKKETFLKDFIIVENETAKVDKYAFVDMDNDGIEELVILTTSDYGAYIVLHYENEVVYGYKIGIRSLESLKKDGTFIASSGATSNEYQTMSFDKNKYKTTSFAVYDTVNKVYKVNGKKVSKEAAKEYTENWATRENVEWTASK